MKTKLTLVMLFVGVVAFAETTFLWPIKNAETGENILLRPQEYIGDELNFYNLIIHAPRGTLVQAPADGVVTAFTYGYRHSLTRMTSFGRTPTTNFEEDIEAIRQNMCSGRRCFNQDIDLNFVSIGLGIRLDDGRMMWISGLHPTRIFRTGERVQRGDIVGTVGYFYHAIPQPAISLNISERGGSVSDPMSPFGLRTTFIPPRIQQPRTNLTAEQATKDFTVLVDALREGFPGLFDFVTEQDFDAHVSQALAQMQNGIRTADFHNIVAGLIRIVRDNHLTILSRPPARALNRYFSPVFFGWLNDSIVITRTLEQYTDFYKRRVIAVDGIPAKELKEKILPYIGRIEGHVESHRDNRLLALWAYYFENIPTASSNRNVSLTFDCGETVLFEGFAFRGRVDPFHPGRADYSDINTELSLKKLSDSVAFLGLPTFGITQTQQDEIAEFIASITAENVQNLIIDLRNNRGGPEAVLQWLFSLIAQQPFYVSQYHQVNRRGGFDFFERTTNFAGVDNLFLEFEPEQGREGYFSRNTQAIYPNETVNFSGRVYVLTNERSLSASAGFAGLVHKHRRGAIVGRETGSTYHQMKALQQAVLRLPYSQIDVNIPLVKIVFDTDTSRIPFGRGVLPDFPLPLSLDELAFVDGDAILNFAKYLIEHGHYLQEPEQPKQNRSILLILILVVVIGIYLGVRHKRRKKSTT